MHPYNVAQRLRDRPTTDELEIVNEREDDVEPTNE
jgi:hypothetical protein